MTEQDWLSATIPSEMLRWAHGRYSDRKYRLYGCASLRRLWDELPDERSRYAVVAAERYVDMQINQHELREAQLEACDAYEEAPSGLAEAALLVAGPLDAERLENLARGIAYVAEGELAEIAQTWVERRRWQCELLRDILGNPFRPTLIGNGCRTWSQGFVIRLAQMIYDEQRGEDMPMLGEALHLAGCTNAHILEHCQSKGPHVRGCWLIDDLLGKQG